MASLLQPGFKPYLTLWFGVVLQADAISSASYFIGVLQPGAACWSLLHVLLLMHESLLSLMYTHTPG